MRRLRFFVCFSRSRTGSFCCWELCAEQFDCTGGNGGPLESVNSPHQTPEKNMIHLKWGKVYGTREKGDEGCAGKNITGRGREPKETFENYVMELHQQYKTIGLIHGLCASTCAKKICFFWRYRWCEAKKNPQQHYTVAWVVETFLIKFRNKNKIDSSFKDHIRLHGHRLFFIMFKPHSKWSHAIVPRDWLKSHFHGNKYHHNSSAAGFPWYFKPAFWPSIYVRAHAHILTAEIQLKLNDANRTWEPEDLRKTDRLPTARLISPAETRVRSRHAGRIQWSTSAMEKARGDTKAENDSRLRETFYRVMSGWLSCNECNYKVVFKNIIILQQGDHFA